MDKNLIYIDPDYNSGASEGVQLIQAMFLQKNDVQSVFTKKQILWIIHETGDFSSYAE